MLKKKIADAASSTDRRPSQEQIESGAYRKGKFDLAGMTIAIETPKNATRSGVDADGHEWSTPMRGGHYGYIVRPRQEE